MKIKQTVIALTLILGIGGTLGGPTVSAAASCGNVDTSIIACGQTGDGNGVCPDGKIVSKDDIKKGVKCSDKSTPDVAANSGVWGILLLVINIMTAGIGILAVAGVVYGSILYTTAGDSSEKVSKAREVIRNVVIGILAYALMYVVLNFIIPGGLFK